MLESYDVFGGSFTFASSTANRCSTSLTLARTCWISSHNSIIRASLFSVGQVIQIGKVSRMLIPCNLTRFFKMFVKGVE